MTTEIWKDVPGYEGLYQASTLGNIKSLSRKVSRKRGLLSVKERVLKPGLSTEEYLLVVLVKDGCKKSRRVHQIIAETFLGHKVCGNKIVVNHINMIKTDNRLVNLEVITHRENSYVKRKNASSKYFGVSWNETSKTWLSKIQINKENLYLGSFKTEIEAHNAYKQKLESL